MKKLLLCGILALLLIPAFAQDAAVITDILAKPTASCMDFSYLVASELGMECSPFEAYSYCDRFGNFSFTGGPNAPVTVKDISYFLMSNFGLKGGMMWSTIHTSRYAWKELKATGFWKSGTDPDTKLSGRDLVRAISKFVLIYPDATLKNPPAKEASDKYLKALLADQENQL